ncbi:MAG: hypothetical protein ABW190_03055 [Rhizobacter sp.]
MPSRKAEEMANVSAASRGTSVAQERATAERNTAFYAAAAEAQTDPNSDLNRARRANRPEPPQASGSSKADARSGKAAEGEARKTNESSEPDVIEPNAYERFPTVEFWESPNKPWQGAYGNFFATRAESCTEALAFRSQRTRFEKPSDVAETTPCICQKRANRSHPEAPKRWRCAAYYRIEAKPKK